MYKEKFIPKEKDEFLQNKNEFYKKKYPFSNNTSLGQDIALIDLISHNIDLSRVFTFLEVGICDARTSSILLDEFLNIEYIGVDPLRGYGSMLQERMDFIKKIALERLGNYKNSTLLTIGSLLAVKLFEDKSLDIVFLDGNHEYDAIRDDLIAWYPKVKHLLAIHDYETHDSVKKATDLLCELYGLKLNYTFGDVAYIIKE